jgi:hypothetical protein
MSLTPEQRRLRASAAAYAQWSKEPDPTARTAKARQAFLSRFEAEIPASVTDPATRARMAEQARQSHFKKLALASSRARSARKKGRADAVA